MIYQSFIHPRCLEHRGSCLVCAPPLQSPSSEPLEIPQPPNETGLSFRKGWKRLVLAAGFGWLLGDAFFDRINMNQLLLGLCWRNCCFLEMCFFEKNNNKIKKHLSCEVLQGSLFGGRFCLKFGRIPRMLEGKELVTQLAGPFCCCGGEKPPETKVLLNWDEIEDGIKIRELFFWNHSVDRFTLPALTPRMIHSTKSTKCQCHVLRSGKPQATASVFEATGHSFTPVTVSTTTSSNNLLLPFCKAPVGIVSKKRYSTITMHLYAFIKSQGNMLLCQLSFTILHLWTLRSLVL